MKPSYKYILVLAVLAPFCAELLNGSTPIGRVFDLSTWLIVFLPYIFLIIWLAYFASRASTSSSRLFLLPIAGLVIEGLITRSFFDPAFPQLSSLTSVGYAGGIQWPWTISLLASHMMTSFLLPLAFATVFISKERQVIGRKAAQTAGIALSIFILFTFAIRQTLPLFAAQLLVTVIMIVVLAYASRKIPVRDSKAVPLSKIWFGVAGFLFAPINWLSSFFLAAWPLHEIYFFQGLFIFAYLYFLWSQWFNPNTTDKKRLIFSLCFYLPYMIIYVLLALR